MKKIRTFIAIYPTQQNRKKVFDFASTLSENFDSLKTVNQENIHLTLKFLGQMDIENTSEVSKKIEECCTSANNFDIEVRGAGAFPNTTRPRTIWVAVKEETGQLTSLQKNIDTTIATLGFKREKRLWSPHITIGRIRKPTINEPLAAKIESAADKLFFTEQVNAIHFFMSELLPTGPKYTTLGVFNVK